MPPPPDPSPPPRRSTARTITATTATTIATMTRVLDRRPPLGACTTNRLLRRTGHCVRRPPGRLSRVRFSKYPTYRPVSPCPRRSSPARYGRSAGVIVLWIVLRRAEKALLTDHTPRGPVSSLPGSRPASPDLRPICPCHRRPGWSFGGGPDAARGSVPGSAAPCLWDAMRRPHVVAALLRQAHPVPRRHRPARRPARERGGLVDVGDLGHEDPAVGRHPQSGPGERRPRQASPRRAFGGVAQPLRASHRRYRQPFARSARAGPAGQRPRRHGREPKPETAEWRAARPGTGESERAAAAPWYSPVTCAQRGPAPPRRAGPPREFSVKSPWSARRSRRTS